MPINVLKAPILLHLFLRNVISSSKEKSLPELLSLYPPVIGGKKATSSLSFMESSNLAVSILIETL